MLIRRISLRNDIKRSLTTHLFVKYESERTKNPHAVVHRHVPSLLLDKNRDGRGKGGSRQRLNTSFEINKLTEVGSLLSIIALDFDTNAHGFIVYVTSNQSQCSQWPVLCKLGTLIIEYLVLSSVQNQTRKRALICCRTTKMLLKSRCSFASLNKVNKPKASNTLPFLCT